MKRIVLLMAAVALCLAAAAQSAVGDWRIHTSFVGSDVKTVAESRQWVYYLAGANLFRLDKQTRENEAMTIVNDLSDMVISQIYYNSDKDALVVVYANSNIDVIKSDGQVVNMPEIKDAVLTTGKTINDVTFAPGLMYLATDFGYVVIDDTKLVVKESHLYGTPLTSVARVGETLLLTSATAAYCGAANEYHEQLSSFSRASFSAASRLWPVGDNAFYCVTGSKVYLVTMTRDVDGSARFDTGSAIIDGRATVIQKTAGGFLLNVPQLEQYFTTDGQGRNPAGHDSGGEACSSHPDGDGSVWAAGTRGLHLLGSESYFLPNALSYASPFWMTYNESENLLYVASTAANAIVSTASPTAINTFDGISWKDVTPDGAPQNGSFWLEFLPGTEGTYLLGTWRDGLYKVEDGEVAFIYNQENSPIVKKWAMHPITSIDRNGNVWVVQSYETEDHPAMVLPAAKAKLDQTTAADWILPTIDGLNTGHTFRSSFISTRHSNYDIKLFTDGDFEMPLFVWNTGGEIPSRPQQVTFSRLTDQDGLAFSWTNIRCLAEDLNGMVWMGTSEGVCMFNPAQAFSGSAFSAVRPKVPRNDGTGLADRLMDGIEVNDVAVDGANRKWIATQSSGLFLVSSDGSQIIRRFNTTNSPLASNAVYKVCCNPNSNSVYITTQAGVYEYFSDSSPAEAAYDNIYAYPNPVRPEFGGSVTIMGLMDNSLVKIADAGGHVLAQLKSTGGMVSWDCCDQYGNEVKSGVYLVLCSQANGSGEAVVTKIAVIR